MASNYFEEKMREFTTGATRDGEEEKVDFEGHFSPVVLEAFGEYMNRCRRCPDGSYRASDNWQLGIPKDAYMKSLWRHFLDVWKEHRGVATKAGLRDALCAMMFNTMGYLFEILREEKK